MTRARKTYGADDLGKLREGPVRTDSGDQRAPRTQKSHIRNETHPLDVEPGKISMPVVIGAGTRNVCYDIVRNTPNVGCRDLIGKPTKTKKFLRSPAREPRSAENE